MALYNLNVYKIGTTAQTKLGIRLTSLTKARFESIRIRVAAKSETGFVLIRTHQSDTSLLLFSEYGFNLYTTT